MQLRLHKVGAVKRLKVFRWGSYKKTKQKTKTNEQGAAVSRFHNIHILQPALVVTTPANPAIVQPSVCDGATLLPPHICPLLTGACLFCAP